MFTIFLQQILGSRLLLVVIVGLKSNLSTKFKLRDVTSTTFLQQITGG